MPFERGIYDPSSGPLVLEFSEPIVPASLRLRLRLDRANPERDVCREREDEDLPAGCTEPARTIVGDCVVDPARAERPEPGSTSTRYPCGTGGSFRLESDGSRVTVEPEVSLVPFERYALEVDPGLEDHDGRVRNVGSAIPFQVASEYPLAPTSFQGGMFFTVFEIDVPVAVEFDFLFWIEVQKDTGEVRLFGSDIDPNDPSIDPKTNRDPADWHPDPNQPSGASIDTRGQVVDSESGPLLVAFPFLLEVHVPAIDAPGVELNARFSDAAFPGAPTPPEIRQRADGRIFAPRVYLGLDDERAFAGEGRGTVKLYRLTAEEAPPLETLMPTGRNADEIRNTFSGS